MPRRAPRGARQTSWRGYQRHCHIARRSWLCGLLIIVLGLSAAKGGRRWKDNCGPTTLDIGGGKQCTLLANGSDRSTPPALLCRVVAGEVFTLEISPKPIPFTAIAWVEGRGMRAPFTARGWGNTIRTPEDIADGGGGGGNRNGGGGSDPAGQSAAARGTFDVLLVDPGRYTVIVDTHVGELVRRTVTGARIWNDNFVCPEQPNATTPVGHGYYYVAPDPQCPMRGCQQEAFRWTRADINITVDVLPEGTALPSRSAQVTQVADESFGDNAPVASRLVDDDTFIKAHRSLPWCTVDTARSAIDPTGFHFKPGINTGRWVSVAPPLVYPTALETLLYPPKSDAANTRLFENGGFLTWVPHSCKLRYLETKDIEKCMSGTPRTITYVGDSRARTQAYNLPVFTRVAERRCGIPLDIADTAPNDSCIHKEYGTMFTKVHETTEFSVHQPDANSTARFQYVYLNCKGLFNRSGSITDPDFRNRLFEPLWNSLQHEPDSVVIFTAGLCHMSYGEVDSDFEPSLNKTLWLLHNLTTASHARVIVKTNESPWRHNAGSCNVARTIVANHVLMKLVRMYFPHWGVLDTFQTTHLRPDMNIDTIHFWRRNSSVRFLGNAMSQISTMMAVNAICNRALQ